MRLVDERDAYGRALCPVCEERIRAIEEVRSPAGRAVHFYCLAAARAAAADDGGDYRNTKPA